MLLAAKKKKSSFQRLHQLLLQHLLLQLSQHLHQPLLLQLRPLMLLLTLPRLLLPMHRKLLMQPKMLRKMLRKMQLLPKTLPKTHRKLLTLRRSNSLPHMKKPTFASVFFRLQILRGSTAPIDRAASIGGRSAKPVETGQQQEIDDLDVGVLPHHFQVIHARVA